MLTECGQNTSERQGTLLYCIRDVPPTLIHIRSRMGAALHPRRRVRSDGTYASYSGGERLFMIEQE